jgi:hypothetical protein
MPLHLRKMISSNVPSGGVLDYDSRVDWYVCDYEAYEKAYQDPCYLEVIEPDEWNFVDKSGSKKGGIAGAVSALGIYRDIVRDGESVVEEAKLSDQQKILLKSTERG